MNYLLDNLEKKLKLPKGAKLILPPAEVDADLAISAFKLDKEKIVKKIRLLKSSLVADVKVVGGYINIKFDTNKLAAGVIKNVLKKKDKYGFNASGKKKTVLVEYSSPNIAKPLHVGHLRNTVLGVVLKNIYSANGYKVLTENWLGDWGKQYGLLILAYQKWGNKNNDIECRYLLDLYIRISKAAKKSKKIDQEARDIFRKLEEGDKSLLKLWKKFRDASVKDFKKTYKRLGAEFDFWHGEHFYTPFMEAVVKEALKKKVAKKEKGGPVVVDLDKYGLRSYLLAKTDGASLYDTRDLATAKYRLKKYKPEKIIHVVGHEQELHLKQLFKTMGLLGYPEEKLKHVSYGLVAMKGVKMSTRVGNIIFLDDLLDEAVKKSKGNKIIGIGAIIYNILSQSNERSISFSWEKALNLRGSSAPYIQYAYVRALGILRKAGNLSYFTSPYKGEEISNSEAELVKALVFYPRVVKKAQENNSPHLIANYLNDLAQKFNRFYEKNPILKAESKVKRQRLLLTKAMAQVIKNGLSLLGIETPNKM